MAMPDEPSSSRGPFLYPPTPQSIQTLLDADAGGDAGAADAGRARTILRHALAHAVTHADVELTTWLTSVQGDLSPLLDEAAADLEDDDGWGVVGMAIQSSCGQAEREEVVRLVVGRWGVDAGPRGGRDRAGWTPLHLAAIVSSPQIVSVLLNRGASAAALTAQGLSPYDLISGMEGREALAILLDPLADQPAPLDDGHIAPQRRELLKRRRIRQATEAARAAKRGELKRIALERERWVRERAKHIGVESSVLFNADEDEAGHEAEDSDSDSDESDNHDPSPDHLVFHINQVPALLDVFVTSYRPVCQPLSRRALPANALYLYARFAHYQCDETWLEELLEGAVDAIEHGVYGNGEDLAFLAFWEYNLTLLLYLLRGDEALSGVCDELNFLTMMEELINAIHVFIIRIAERKIDEIMDAAMLDFEALEDFDDVRFTDEWNLFRSFGAKKKRDSQLAQAIFSLPNTPERPDRSKRDSAKLHRRVNSIQDLRVQASAATAEAKEAIAHGMSKAQAVFGDKASPRKVTDILTSVLLILQLYEVNPAFIVQVFSQTFFWISSELFNRIITRKKYLCRTKAVQIRMNITALEDWTRANGLPPNIASTHLEPVMQLLTWLQCSSQITEFDTLIGTVQTLRALNPLQMRRAVQNYRFEVNESHMADDCVQYLAQLQRDWDRRRVQIGSAAHAVTAEDSMPIEALFDGGTAIGDWTPQTAPESPGELLDSRFMLPFLIPRNEFLLAAPPPDTAYRNLLLERPLAADGSIPSRPLSSASFSSSAPLGWVRAPARVRDMPPDFFSWLKARQAEAQGRLGYVRPRTDSRLREEPGRVDLAEDDEVEELLGEDALAPLDATPTRLDAPPVPGKEAPFPQLFAPPPLSGPGPGTPSKSPFASPTLGARASFGSLSSPTRDRERHARQASAELAYRPSPPRDVLAENIELITRANDSMKANGAGGHYELGRVQRQRQASVSSVNSVASAGSAKSGKKKWWQIRKSSGAGTDDGRRTREGTAETIRPSPRESPVKAAPAAPAA